MALKLLTFLAIFATFQNGQGLVIELDDSEDQNDSVFIGNSCTYFQNYTSFNETDCLIDWNDPEESGWENKIGAWGPCFNKPIGGPPSKSCTIMYFGHSLNYPTNITIEGRVKGNGVIEVHYKNSVLDENDKFKPADELKFSTTSADPVIEEWVVQSQLFIQKDHAFVFNFTITVPDGNSFAMIDRIILQTDDEEPPTTEAPPTEAPPGVIGEYLLDTAGDISSVWTEINCAHAEIPEDFWAYGCELEEGLFNESDKATEWWTPCAYPSCDFIFDSKSNNTQRPSMITLKGVIKAGAVIEIRRRKTGLGAIYTLLNSYVALKDGDTYTYKIPKDCDYDFYKFTINNAVAPIVIDSIKVEMIDEGVGECSGEAEETTTPAPTSTAPSTTTPGNGNGTGTTTTNVSTTPDGAVAIFSSTVLVVVATLVTLMTR